MLGWYHQLSGHEFEQILGDHGGQRNLVCCSQWGRKQSDTTEWLNDRDLTVRRSKKYVKSRM